MTKIKRSRDGCFNCKKRRRKCDESKPVCQNCIKAGKECQYGIRLTFDVDDSRNLDFLRLSNGKMKYGFRGRPRIKDSQVKEPVESSSLQSSADTESEPAASVEPPQVSRLIDVPMVQASSQSTIRSYPMEAISSIEHLSGSTVFDGKELDQETFDFINRGVDYLLGGLQSTLGANNNLAVDTTAGSGLDEAHLKEETPFSFNEEEQLRSEELVSFLDNANLYPSVPLSNSDENLVLRHFFNRLLPLLDSHPNNPWPELALKYCDFEIAKSCFLSLSCMHLYGNQGGNEYYKTGMRHINSTMNYLIKYLNKNGSLAAKLNFERKYNDELKDDINVDRIVGNLKDETVNQKRSSFFVILILIYVHVLFSILENGRSVMSRVFFQLFSTIARDPIFKAVLERIDQSQTFICILSWYDTISAVASPDCRLPYCDPLWYGRKNTETTLAKMVGCPGEIFECIARICHLRLALKNNELSFDKVHSKYNEIKFDLLNYREYVALKLNTNDHQLDDSIQLKPEDDYSVRLRGAQCWTLSALVKLESILKFEESKERIETLINEFIMVYSSMDPECTTVVQMVWPVFNIASECITANQKESVRIFLENLNQNGQTGVLRTLKRLVDQSWSTGQTMDEILSGKDWLESGTDFLPL